MMRSPSLGTMKQLNAAIATATVVCGLSGCVFGVTKLDVTHSPLPGATTKREGTILVTQFVDGRSIEHRAYIGNKRNGYGMVLGHLGTRDGVDLTKLLTGYFVEALQHAGYDAVLQPSASSSDNIVFDVILKGEIKEFWLDLYMATWHNVDVALTLKDRSDTRVLWERNIHGDKTNILWFGASGEFERVIRQALDNAMDRALKEFASPEFQSAVQQSNAPPGTSSSSGRPAPDSGHPPTEARR
jgi:hypothetical protein